MFMGGGYDMVFGFFIEYLYMIVDILFDFLVFFCCVLVWCFGSFDDYWN